MPKEIAKYVCDKCQTQYDSYDKALVCEKYHWAWITIDATYKQNNKYPCWVEVTFDDDTKKIYYDDEPVYEEPDQQSAAEIEMGYFQEWYDAWFPSGDDKDSGSKFFTLLREEETKGRSRGQSRLQTLKDTFLRLRDLIDGNPILSTNPEDHF